MHDDDTLFDETDDAACMRALAFLLDVGNALALECKTPGPDASLADRCKAFERVAVATRRTILLFQHLKQNVVDPEVRMTQARKAIIRKVEDTIERAADPADAPALRVELVERLDSPDFAADLAHRSPADLIRELCADFGLAGNLMHCRRTPDDIAILCAQAAAGQRPRPIPKQSWAKAGPPNQTSPPNPPTKNH